MIVAVKIFKMKKFFGYGCEEDYVAFIVPKIWYKIVHPNMILCCGTEIVWWLPETFLSCT